MHSCAGLVVYLVGILWLLLFPLVSISSGELKPRSLYIDEHALLINSGTKYLYAHGAATYSVYNSSLNDEVQKDELCNMFHCQELYMSNDEKTNPIVHIELNSRHLETIVISFIVSPSQRSNNYITSIAKQIKDTKWIAKNVLLLLIYQDCANDKCDRNNNELLYSERIERWFQLHYHHRYGLLRQNFIVDLTQIDKVSGSDSMTELMYVGVDGQLPNMDLLSAALAVLPPHVVVEGRSKRYANAYEKEHPMQYLPTSSLPRVLQLLVLHLHQIISNLFGKTAPIDDYFHRLTALFEHLFASAKGPSGVHSQFQLRNIDSMTLRYHNQSSYDVTNDVMKLVRVANNLHEELHHSHFYYLIMGHRHFVGITEYASNYLLLLVPIILAYFHYCTAIKQESIELKANGVDDVTQVLLEYGANLLAFFLYYYFHTQYPRGDFAMETVLFVVTQFNALRNTKKMNKLTILRDKIYSLLAIATYVVVAVYGGVVHYALMLPIVLVTSPIILCISHELVANRRFLATLIAVVVSVLLNPMSTKYILIHTGILESQNSIQASNTVFLMCLIAYTLYGLAFKVLFSLYL
jgi:hypothetical protein